MQQDVLSEILAWSVRQPGWQRDALRRLFATGTLGASDLDDLLELCKAKHGLSSPRGVQPLAEKHLAIKENGAAPVSLVSVTHHGGVNALASEQTVTFGPNLTIVYGENATGKSGYTRILKRACRARSAEDILGNVLAEDAPLKAQVTIRFRAGQEEEAVAWTPDAPPPDRLAAVNVFDSQCAPIYLRDKTDVAFRPFGLDVFDKLASACGELRKRLDGELAALRSAPSPVPKVPEGTQVAALLSGLTSLTKADDVKALATLSSSDTQRLAELRERRRDLQASDPTKRARELELKASRVELVAGHVAALGTLLDDAALAAIAAARQRVDTARAALAHLRAAVLTPGLLPGTGEEAWRRMWDAAHDFSGVGYPAGTFPVTAEGARCLLCQQPIGPEAADRFAHFAELVSSTAQADVRQAEAAYHEALGKVTSATVSRSDVTLALDEIGADDAALAQRVRDFAGKAAPVRDGIIAAAKAAKSFATNGVETTPEGELRTLATTLRQRAKTLRGQSLVLEPEAAAELKELEARAMLQDHLDSVIGEIEKRQRIAAYGQCVEDTNTGAVTRKSTELTKRLVTDRLRDQFREELKSLDFTHLAVEVKPVGGARGALFHQLVFSNAPNVVVSKVLSEGEGRALSLASFLAELSTAAAPSAIVFDDPVSSLDHVWRERIARRLVREAKSRQGIVFTHDLFFLRTLLDECGSRTCCITTSGCGVARRPRVFALRICRGWRCA